MTLAPEAATAPLPNYAPASYPDPPVPPWPTPAAPPASVPPIVAPPMVAPPAQRSPGTQLGQRLFARPPGFPNVGAWLVTGAFRDWRAISGAILVSVFNIPLAFFLGGVGLVVGGISGFLGGMTGAFNPDQIVPGFESIHEIPVIGTAVETFLFKSGGVLGMFTGMALFSIVGFLAGLLLPWLIAFEDPAVALGLFLGQLAAAFFLGVLYTVYRTAIEGISFRLAGAREPSRREKELLMPVLRDAADRLRLGGYPKLLMDDSREPNAYCGARHIVVNRGLLDEFNYDPQPIAGVLCHELTHWRNADTISTFFVRGMVLPYYLVYIAVTWAIQRFRHPVVQFILWMISWPLMLSIRYVMMPLQGMGSRSAEYAADQGAVMAGHRHGLRRVLSRFRTSFDGARNGWDLSICATHPPNELRLERIEEQGVNYPLPDADAPARPLPVVVSSGIYKD